jgi:hypothetical protein
LEKLLSGSLSGESNLSAKISVFKFANTAENLKKEKEIDVAISKNGDISSGSIFLFTILPKNIDGSNVVYIPFLNKSHAKSLTNPPSNFSVEIYSQEYLSSKLFAKVNFSNLSNEAQIQPMNGWKNLESGDKLLYVSDHNIHLGENFNDLTFGINMAFGVCK